ncbi:hypothetical protein [Paenibacillus sp. FSL H3-0286]|uniref:hypothetical protein n=1 Tax=Paenibacillus sp. FSL H3-0286 TaxID=2921427 RepID=UPI00324FAA5B
MPNWLNFREVFPNYRSDEQKSLKFREKFPNCSISASLIASLGASLDAALVMLRTKKRLSQATISWLLGQPLFCEKMSLFLMLDCYRSVVKNRGENTFTLLKERMLEIEAPF